MQLRRARNSREGLIIHLLLPDRLARIHVQGVHVGFQIAEVDARSRTHHHGRPHQRLRLVSPIDAARASVQRVHRAVVAAGNHAAVDDARLPESRGAGGKTESPLELQRGHFGGVQSRCARRLETGVQIVRLQPFHADLEAAGFAPAAQNPLISGTTEGPGLPR